MLKKLELDVLTADLNTVESLLALRTEEEDPIGFFQFTARKNELESAISKLRDLPIRHAELGVFFGGGPVQGSRGINVDFAGKSLDDVQTIISKLYSVNDVGPLKQRGRVPSVDRSQMLLTNTVRGSFGFILEESCGNEELVCTPLQEVVAQVTHILSRVGVEDEAIFNEAASELDARILATLKQFFQRLDDQEATLRIVSGDRDFLLNRNAVSLARNRIQEIEIVESSNEFTGTLYILPKSRRFELHTEDEHGTLSGVVAPEALKQIEEPDFFDKPIDVRQISQKRWRVEIKTREIRERNRSPRRVYSLQHLTGQALGNEGMNES